MNDLVFYANEVVRDTVDKAAKHYNRSFPIPTLRFDIRGRTAGQAIYNTNVIRLNPTLFRENENQFITKTIPHEVAHLISRQVFGKNGRGHGEGWKSVMRALGVIEITRCHSYDTKPSRIVRRFAFGCNCAGKVHRVSSVKVNRMRRGRVTYSCKICRTDIRPI